MKLSELEISILRDIIECHQDTHPGLSKQLDKLTVKEREFTGFGIYVNFNLDNQLDLFEELERRKTCIGSSSEYYLDTLEYQISFELNLSSTGKFEFLEIVLNGVDEWNGEYLNFKKITNWDNTV